MRYRRSSVAGGTFFFTVNLADPSSRLLTYHIELLRGSVRKVRQSVGWAELAKPNRLQNNQALSQGGDAMRYRRSNIAGGTFFFTVNLEDRRSRRLTDHIDLLRHSVCKVRQSHPFEIVAMVVLPDHLHAIWRLPCRDCDFPLRWSLVKAGFSRALEKTERVGTSRAQKRERGIWQRRYWEHQIRNDTDLARHVDYIHINPVKHGYVTTPTDWPYSSLHRYIRRGLLPHDWAAGMNEPDTTGFGERV